MRTLNNSNLGSSMMAGVVILLATSCGGMDEPRGEGGADSVGDFPARTDGLWRHRHPRGSGGSTSVGGSTSTGGTTSAGGAVTVSCDLCTTAQECCNAVSAGSLCMSSAATCSSLDPGRQKTYATHCLVTLRTTITAWALSGRMPPAACVLPF